MTAPRAATRVVAIVPVFNGAPILVRCLDALAATASPHLDVVVADDGSSDASVAIAGQYAAARPGVRVLAAGANRGFAGAVNRAVADVLARGAAPDVLVLVNQDCIVSPGWLAPLVAALGDPGVAVAGARLLDADGATLQHAGARIEANGLTTHLGRGSRDPLAWRDSGDRDYVCGALFAMRTDVWRRYGPFDEGYAPAYYEEVDFCVRVREAGLRVVYVAGCEAVHLEASTSGSGSRAYLRRYHRNRLRFVVRHLASRGAFAWLAAEARWLLRLRRWREIAPVIRAYAEVPSFAAEVVRARRRLRRTPHAQRAAAAGAAR